MDHKNKALLQQNQKDIVRDLDVTFILDELFTKKAISPEDFDHIFNVLRDRTERTRFLLETLIANGSNQSYEAFVDSLAKDYRWLWELFALDPPKHKMADDIEDSLSRGDVPRLPDHYVPRMKLEQDVAAKLNLLTRHKILVLHGMSGSGKTSVAVGVLRNHPELITNNCNGAVFWINCGNVKTQDDVMAQQHKLLRKASTMYTHRDNSYMNSSISMSSIGSNNDSQSLTSYDLSWQDFRDHLKKQFSELSSLKEALLVLDEVNERSCVEAFDVGCKILLTTRDTGVVLNFNPQIVKIENNFDERESLQLFASCLDVDVSKLPRQAKKLHLICKGSPFHIALIGAQLAENKERLLDDARQWNYYIDKLAKKEFFFLTRHSDKPMKTVEMCINSLKPHILPLFKMLAILPDNVKVTAKVLSKLWNIQLSDVESIMKQLRSKSLIIELYDQEQRNYTYEVHDLIMNYLKTCLTEEEVKKLHIDFLKSYKYDTIDNSPLELVDDGYIAFYIGHHILHTKNLNNKWSLFKLFLNLKFLGNKVRLTGPADAIMDFQKYEALIASDELDRELLISLKGFLSTHGTDLFRYPSTDIVQSILQHESCGLLLARALHAAQRNAADNELYFDLLHEQDVEEIKHTTIDVKETITSACFFGDYVLVGGTTGDIKIFHIDTNKLKKELASIADPMGRSGEILWVGTSPANGLYAAAVTRDGVLRIWYLDDVDQELSDQPIDEETEDLYDSPATRDRNETISPKLGPVINCRWSNNELSLITHTSKFIIIYATDKTVVQLIDINERDKQIICCVPSNDDKYLIAATVVNSRHYIEVFNAVTKEKVMSFEEEIAVTNILTVPDTNRFLIFNEEEVIEHQLKIHNLAYAQNGFNSYRTQRIITSQEIKEKLRFITAVVNKAGTLLFISTDDSRVLCIDLKTNLHVFDLDNRRGNVITMSVSEVWYDDFAPCSDVLLTGTDSMENSVKVWFLDASFVSHATQKHRKVRLTTKFDVSFLNTLSPYTPSGQTTPPSDHASQSSTPKRHKSFVTPKVLEKRPAQQTMSLDRYSLKPLNLKGICNVNDSGTMQPLLAVVDDKNNIQIIRGQKVLSEITTKSDDRITAVKISPCNQYVIFGLQSGSVKKYIIRSKETRVIMDINSSVQYLKFVNSKLMVVEGKNRCLMAYKEAFDGEWRLEMLQKGNTSLGSQEILNDLQGNKKKNGQADSLSQSGSEASFTSKDRLFPAGDMKSRFCRGSCLVECFHVPEAGLLTVESNATVKLWSEALQLVGVLSGRQADVHVSCTALSKRVLVICDHYGKFQTFELKKGDDIRLQTTNDSKVNYKIISCDLTSDGNILAMGLDSGDVVIWNVQAKWQLKYLRHHKSKVQACYFSPLPDRLYRSSSTAQSPGIGQAFSYTPDDDQPPLVLVTMASEVVWWNVTYLIRLRANNKGSWRSRINVLSPVSSPLDPRVELAESLENLNLNMNKSKNFFFGDGDLNALDCWAELWKKKKCKEGSKRKEILACIKLSGMNARKLCHDDRFSCFVTVDNPGHIHIMSVMRPNS